MNPVFPSDNALLARYVSGDRAGAEELFERHQKALLHYLWRRLGSRDLAQEGLQETFCRCLERARELIRHPRLGAWLFAVARNVAVDVARRRRRVLPLSEVGGLDHSHRLEGPEALRPECRLQSRELVLAVRRAMTSMAPQEREVFLLRAEAGLPFRVIASRLGAPLNTVLSRMHRAMKRVRREVEAQGWSRSTRIGSIAGSAPKERR